MATQPETKIDTAKAEAAAEKAYAAAAGEVSAKKASAAETVKVEEPESPKIDRAVAEVKAAPRKQPAAKKAAAQKVASKAKPAAKAKSAARKVVKTAQPTKAPASPVLNLKDKIMATAKKTTETDFTAKAKEMAAEAQTRAKATYDKLQTYAGEMTEFTKGNVEAIVESGKILGSGVQDMARGELAVAKGAFETATADLKAMAAVKSPTEFFKLQGEIARRNFDAAVAHYSKNAEVSMKIAGDAFAPISNRMSLAVEKFSKAA
jgi:phasin family protein